MEKQKISFNKALEYVRKSFTEEQLKAYDECDFSSNEEYLESLWKESNYDLKVFRENVFHEVVMESELPGPYDDFKEPTIE